jgi:hypothetical protein
MLFRKHTAFRVVCLYAMVTAVCAIGPALSARRHNSQKSEQHLLKMAGAVNDHTSLKAAKNVSAMEQVVAHRRNESSFVSKSKNTLPGFATTGNFVYGTPGNFFFSQIRIVKTYSRLLRPGYYSFLFRYTPF